MSNMLMSKNDATVFVDVGNSSTNTDNDVTNSLEDANLVAKTEKNIEPKFEKEDNGVNHTKGQNKRIKCPECRRFTAENEEKMIRHIRHVHRGENPFQCYMCDYGTYNKVLFEEHVRIHQGIKPYKCSFCPHKSVSKKNLKKHELIHRPDNPLKCPHCDHIARHRNGALHHAKKFHPSKQENNSVTCGKCNKSFDKLCYFKAHEENVKKCSDCDFKACTTRLIMKHKEKAHGVKYKKMEKKEGWFKCALCDWSANSKPRILLHLIHHPNQTVDESVIDLSILRKHQIITRVYRKQEFTGIND